MAKYLGQTSRFLDLGRSEGEFKVVVITFWSGNPLRKLHLSVTKQPFVSFQNFSHLKTFVAAMGQAKHSESRAFSILKFLRCCSISRVAVRFQYNETAKPLVGSLTRSKI